MLMVLIASTLGRGGSMPKRRGGSPVSTQRQNFVSAVSSRCWVVKWISRNGHFHPLAAACYDGKHCNTGCRHPHVMLQLRHVLLWANEAGAWSQLGVREHR